MLSLETLSIAAGARAVRLAAADFAAKFLGQKLKLRILSEKLLIISARFFGIPPFRFDALVDAIRQVHSRTAPLCPRPATPDSCPLQLFLACHRQEMRTVLSTGC